jgi:2-methylaconitate cis-trans-isomerase PrpF
MRGGTSKGPYFRLSDVPEDRAVLERFLLAVMGSPDQRQIDGLGGADWLTSKTAMVGPSKRPGVDVDFLFGQVLIDKASVDFRPNCGNLTSAVGPFAIESGMIKARDPETKSASST